MRRIRIEHTTNYEYPEPVMLLGHRLHVRPREGHDIRIESSRLHITPAHIIQWQRDVFGNSVAVVNFDEPGDRLCIRSDVVVEHYEEQPLDFLVADHARQYPFHYDPLEQIELMPYQFTVFPREHTVLREWMSDIYRPGKLIETAMLLDTINRKIGDSLKYEIREAPGVQSPAETLQRRAGSCRDLATLFIEACRYCGLASRFVSGYLVSSSAVEDVSSTHAWAEVYLPGAGWRGFDSTSGRLASGDHIAVAVHRHPESIPPVSGSFVGPPALKPTMTVQVDVTHA